MLRNVFSAYVVRVEKSGGNEENGDQWKFVEYRVVVTDEVPTDLDDQDGEVYIVNDYSSRQRALDVLLEMEKLV